MAIGVVTAIGGFVDIGELVAMLQAWAEYRFGLLWAVLLGTVGAIAYAEMTGRVELASQRTVFDLIRERLGLRLGLVPLAAATLLNVLMLVAEIGGMALVLELASGVEPIWLIAPLAFGLVLFELKGTWTLLENIPSLLGLALLVVPAALVFGGLHVDWGAAAHQLVLPRFEKQDVAVYLITAIAVLGAGMSPYEWYFYSSGGREEEWTVRDVAVNRVTAIAGFSLGSMLAFALLVGAATVFFPRNISPAHLFQAGLIPTTAFGTWGMALFLVGAFGCVLGASIEVSLATAQGIAQFFGSPWGSSRPPREVKGFTLAYVLPVLAALAILFTGVDPIKVTVIALAFTVVALPLTFLPLLIVANDPLYMGDLRNGRLSNGLGLVFLAVLTLAGLAAIPLLVITGGAG
ncbi:MAG: Nramp family divalent metal transporter [Gaiellales bacterium]